jgi:hypothetical protein
MNMHDLMNKKVAHILPYDMLVGTTVLYVVAFPGDVGKLPEHP